MNRIQLTSKILVIVPIVLIMLASLFPPLVFPEGLGDKAAAYERTFSGSRGCLFANEMTYWIKTQHFAVRPEGFEGTWDELIDSGIEYEKIDGLDKDDPRETISTSSQTGRESRIDVGRLLAEIFFCSSLLAGLLLCAFLTSGCCDPGR